MLLTPISKFDLEGPKWEKLVNFLILAVNNAGISYTMAYPLQPISKFDSEGVKWEKLGAWMQLLAENISGGGGGGGITQLTGDVLAGPGSGSEAAVLSTVNANVGSFGSATQSSTFTVTARGRITAAGATTVTPAVGSITGLGTGVSTFLATPSSANLAAAVTGETGTGALVFGTSPSLTTPNIGTPSAGNLSSCTTDGTNPVGFRNIPQNSQSTAYTTVLADSGKHLLHPTADDNARTFTLAANASVAYPIGSAITFVNQINVLSIAINSDTLVWAQDGSTGTRTLAANGIATAVKIATTTWLISGTQLS